MTEITELTYLYISEPWRFKENIKYYIETLNNNKILPILKEVGTAYLMEYNMPEKLFTLYFEKDLQQEIIYDNYKPKKMQLIHEIIDGRKKIHSQTLEDYEKIYALIRTEAIKRDIDISKYPKTLEELFT